MTHETELTGRWALILGASSGFGRAASLELARRGMNIFGVHLDLKATLPLAKQTISEIEAMGRFEKGTLAMLCLEKEGESHNYFLNTSATWHLAMCSGAFLEKDERDIKIHISKLGLHGVFKVKLIVNDKKYQTGVSICCS